MVSKGFPNVTINTSGRQYNIGEKATVILYTYINLYARTPKPQSFLFKSPGLQLFKEKSELLFLTISALVANPKKTTLHGGQSRSWSADQGKNRKKKV